MVLRFPSSLIVPLSGSTVKGATVSFAIDGTAVKLTSIKLLRGWQGRAI